MDYLQHHGILGMKWGVRRYQNEDGSLTSAGKKRYSADISANHQKTRKNRVDDADLKDPNRWVREDISRSKAIADSGKQLTRELQSINRALPSRKSSNKMDLSGMTDKELRDKINRELLEKQYNDMFNTQKTSKGREYVTQTLEIAGGVLTVAASSLGIALAIKELKG